MSALQQEVPVLAAGQLLAPGYRVVEHVSRGEALDVYEVFSEQRWCSCVAKTVRPDRAHVPRVRDRLLAEGRLLEQLAHPHLLRAFETVHDPVPIVVTETLPGLTLEELIELRRRRLPSADLAHLGRQLCAAVQYLHGAGVLHLDVRPANIVVTDGRVVLLDLSLARPPGPAHRGIGTDEYLSPEQARGGHLAAPADVWGIGATLYEAATALPPFASAEKDRPGGRRAYAQLQGPPAPIGRLRRGLHPALAEAVRECLQPDPDARPTVRELWTALGTVIDDD